LDIQNLKIIMRGAGDLATGVALRLHRAGFTQLLLLETEHPLAVRRLVAFSETVAQGTVTIEGICGKRLDKHTISTCWSGNETQIIPVLVDPAGESIQMLRPHVVIDAIIAKQNTGTRIDDAGLVIGLGPGFTAGKDVHCVIETMRGHGLGRVLYSGSAMADTGVPGNIGGYTGERLLRAPQAGTFTTTHEIGDRVEAGEQVATVDGRPVNAAIAGVVRGLLRPNTPVTKGTKLGDIDPRGKTDFCRTASDKAMAIGGGVLEAILRHYNGAQET
jgi:xanthine dehydrogenase accessory factor